MTELNISNMNFNAADRETLHSYLYCNSRRASALIVF